MRSFPESGPTGAMRHVRRPLAGLTLAFVGGLYLRMALPAARFLLLWPVVFGFGLIALWGARRRAGAWALFAGWLLAGYLVYGMSLPGISGRDLHTLIGRPREQVELTGEITDDPVRVSQGKDGATLWTFRLQAAGLCRLEGGWQRARGAVNVRARLPPGLRPSYGDTWRFHGVLARGPGRPSDPEQLDVRPGDAGRLSTGGGWWLMRQALAGRRACARLLARGLDGARTEAGILSALMLGYRADLPDEIFRIFLATGTLHIFAISGAHVAMASALILFVLRAAGLPKTRWFFILAPLLTLYTLATGLAPSAVRAWIMALVYWSALAAGRRPDLASSLALAALLILAADPRQLHDAGFLFSFLTVAGLMALTPPLLAPLRARGAADPWASPEPDRAGRRWRQRALEGLAGLAAASLAASLASAPMSAWYGNLISPIGLLANLVVIPGAFLVMLTGCLSLVFGAVAGWLAEVFNHANRWFVDILVGVTQALFRVPGGHVYVQSPPVWALVMSYAALAGFLLLRGRPRRVLAAALIAVAGAAAARYVTDPRVTVEVAERGLAPAVFLNVPGGGDVLVDPGPAYRATAVVRWLHARGVDRLRAVWITQPDAAHAGALADVLARIPTEEIWVPSARGRSRLFRELIVRLQAEGRRVRDWSRGDEQALAGGARLRVWHPPAGVSYARAEEAALLWEVERGEARVLVAGPGTEGARQSWRTGAHPAADALVLSRDGMRPPSLEWLVSASPDLLVWQGGSPFALPPGIRTRPAQLSTDEGGVRIELPEARDRKSSGRRGPGITWMRSSAR